MAATDDPGIQEVIARHEAASAAATSGDLAGFARHLAPELMVNSPGDRVLPRAGVIKAFELGLIDYVSCDTKVEHAARRPNGEVLLMGAEVVTPRRNNPHVGQAVTYRFTEIWRPDESGWLLAVRQATIRSVRDV